MQIRPSAFHLLSYKKYRGPPLFRGLSDPARRLDSEEDTKLLLHVVFSSLSSTQVLFEQSRCHHARVRSRSEVKQFNGVEYIAQKYLRRGIHSLKLTTIIILLVLQRLAWLPFVKSSYTAIR